MRFSKSFILAIVVLCWSAVSAAQLRQIAIIEVPGRPGFDDAAMVNGYLVMAHAGANTVEIFDPSKRRMIARVEGMSEPRGIAVDEPGSRIYVANAANNTITVLSSKDWMVQDNIKVPASPDALLYVPQVQTLYAGNWHDGSISAIRSGEAGARAQVQAVPLDGRPEDMAFDPARKLLYCAVQDHNEVVALDPELKIAAHYKLAGSQPTGLAIDEKGRRLFVAIRHAVVVLDLDSGKELGRVPTGTGTDKLWFDESTQTLYAATGAGTITVIKADGNRYSADQELETDIRGHTLAFDSARKQIYVPGGRDGRSKLVILKRFEVATPRPSVQAARR
jgi:DNA-binding beta-propeller fold protein YncE